MGERALAFFEAQCNVWWACRTLWFLSTACNAIGEWRAGFGYCRRALEHGQAVNDLRLKIVGWYRTGSTHTLRGDAEAGVRCFDEALKLSPIPFDATLARAFKGFALAKAGQVRRDRAAEGCRRLAGSTSRTHARSSACAWPRATSVPGSAGSRAPSRRRSSIRTESSATCTSKAGPSGCSVNARAPMTRRRRRFIWSERQRSSSRWGSKRAGEDARGPGGAAGRGWRSRDDAAAPRPSARDLRRARDARRPRSRPPAPRHARRRLSRRSRVADAGQIIVHGFPTMR